MHGWARRKSLLRNATIRNLKALWFSKKSLITPWFSLLENKIPWFSLNSLIWWQPCLRLHPSAIETSSRDGTTGGFWGGWTRKILLSPHRTKIFEVFLCTVLYSNHSYHARHSHRGGVFLTHTNSLQNGLKSIRYMGANMWNDLPEELRNSPSTYSFKKHLENTF